MAKPSALRYMDRPANRLTAGQTHRTSCVIFSEIFCFLGSARSMTAQKSCMARMNSGMQITANGRPE